LFAAGFLPAIDITRSVSRIGGKAQHPAIKVEAGRMKLDYLQFQELEIFTRFGSRLEASVEAKIRRGRLLRELLKQERLAPLAPEQHMAWLVAYNEGLFDGLDGDRLATKLSTLMEDSRLLSLSLENSREDWLQAVRAALAGGPDEPAA